MTSKILAYVSTYFKIHAIIITYSSNYSNDIYCFLLYMLCGFGAVEHVNKVITYEMLKGKEVRNKLNSYEANQCKYSYLQKMLK